MKGVITSQKELHRAKNVMVNGGNLSRTMKGMVRDEMVTSSGRSRGFQEAN